MDATSGLMSVDGHTLVASKVCGSGIVDTSRLGLLLLLSEVSVGRKDATCRCPRMAKFP